MHVTSTDVTGEKRGERDFNLQGLFPLLRHMCAPVRLLATHSGMFVPDSEVKAPHFFSSDFNFFGYYI